MSDQPKQVDAPPQGEHIHMPAPSILPLINSAALAGVIIFVTLSTIVCIAFLIVFLISTGVWIKKAIEETNELPLDHHH